MRTQPLGPLRSRVALVVDSHRLMFTHRWIIEAPLVVKKLHTHPNEALPGAVAIGRLAIAFVLDARGEFLPLKTHCVEGTGNFNRRVRPTFLAVIQRRVPNFYGPSHTC